jgi:hypothetical protein
VRNPATPELPTIAEVYPGFEALSLARRVRRRPARRSRSWIGCANELKEVAAQPEFKERLANTGSGEPYLVTPRSSPPGSRATTKNTAS